MGSGQGEWSTQDAVAAASDGGRPTLTHALNLAVVSGIAASLRISVVAEPGPPDPARPEPAPPEPAPPDPTSPDPAPPEPGQDHTHALACRTGPRPVAAVNSPTA